MKKLTLFFVCLLCFSELQAQCEVAIDSDQDTLCSGEVIELEITNDISSEYTISWYFYQDENPSTEIQNESSETLNFPTLELVGSISFYARITSNEEGGCSANSDTLDFFIQQLPVFEDLDLSFCSGEEVIFNPNNSDGYTGLTYTAIINQDGQQIDTLDDVNSLEYNFPEASTISLFYDAIVTPRINGCEASTFQVEIEIKPRPSISVTQYTDSICSGLPISFYPQTGNSLPNTSIDWEVLQASDIDGANNGSGNSLDQTLVNGSNAPAIVSYSFILESNECESEEGSLSVTVLPVAQISNLASQSLCSGASFTLNLSAESWVIPENSLYSWQYSSSEGVTGGESVLNETSSINYNLINNSGITRAAQFLFSVSSSGCLSDTVQIPILVKPRPSINDFFNTICSGDVVQITPGFSGNIIPVGTTYNWTPPTVSGIQGISNSASQTLTNSTNELRTVDYQIVPTADGCQGETFTSTIEVKPKPDIESYTVSTCSGVPIDCTPTAGIIPAGTTYSWSFQNNQSIEGESLGNALEEITQLPINSTYQDENYQLTVTPEAVGCSGSVFNVTVNVLRAPRLVTSNDVAICEGEQVQLFAAELFSLSGILFNWTNSENAETLNFPFIPNPTASPIESTTYVVSVVDPQNVSCIVSDSIRVTVHPLPSSGLPTEITFCEGESTLVDGEDNYSYSWVPGLGVEQIGVSQFVLNPNSSIIYNVLINDANGCTNEESIAAVVKNNPVLNYTASSLVCAGDVFFGQVNSPEIDTEYTWMNEDGEILFSGSSYTSSPLFSSQIINLEATNSAGCSTNESIFVQIANSFDLPIIGPSQACQESVALFYSVPVIGSYFWIVGNGEIVDGQGTNTIIVNWFSGSEASIEVYGQIPGNTCGSFGELQVTLVGQAPPVLSVTQLFAGSSTLVLGASNFELIQWGMTSISTGQDIIVAEGLSYHSYGTLDLTNFYYWVEHGSVDGCVTRSYFNFPDIPNSVNELINSEINFYPNPSLDGVFHLRNVANSNLLFKLLDSTGSIVMESVLSNGQQLLDLSHLSAGVYLLNTIDGSKSKSHRLVISK